jgi:16S rRNA (uracil1498-N3)-methyltransferase
MRLHRFYIQTELHVGVDINVEDTEHIHQWVSVFRYKTGDSIILFNGNGNGNEYTGTFSEIHKKQAVINITSEVSAIMPNKNGKEVHLYLAAIKKDLFELAVEKCTELGVSSITPIITERTQDKNLNIERLMKVSIEASEQSGRGDVPEINKSVSLHDALESSKGYSVFIADITPLPVSTPDSPSRGDTPATLFIGPEGGWGEKDFELFKAYNPERISLGETTLRAETAAIVGCFTLLK